MGVSFNLDYLESIPDAKVRQLYTALLRHEEFSEQKLIEGLSGKQRVIGRINAASTNTRWPMKTITKTTIGENLKSLDKLFVSSRSAKKALFYSKLAIFELCGWIEETMDRVVRSCATRNLKDQHNRKFIEEKAIKKNPWAWL